MCPQRLTGPWFSRGLGSCQGRKIRESREGLFQIGDLKEGKLIVRVNCQGGHRITCIPGTLPARYKELASKVSCLRTSNPHANSCAHHHLSYRRLHHLSFLVQHFLHFSTSFTSATPYIMSTRPVRTSSVVAPLIKSPEDLKRVLTLFLVCAPSTKKAKKDLEDQTVKHVVAYLRATAEVVRSDLQDALERCELGSKSDEATFDHRPPSPLSSHRSERTHSHQFEIICARPSPSFTQRKV
jgi:hypothetical protein